MIAAITILMILTGMAIPLAVSRELRHAIWEMRDGIDVDQAIAHRTPVNTAIYQQLSRIHSISLLPTFG